MSEQPDTFPYSIPKQGKPIIIQEDLIQDLTIALGLIQSNNKENTEQWAKLMIELINRPIEYPAEWESAFIQAKQNIQ